MILVAVLCHPLCPDPHPRHVSQANPSLLGASAGVKIQSSGESINIGLLIPLGSMNLEVLSSKHFQVQDCETLAVLSMEMPIRYMYPIRYNLHSSASTV